MALAGVRAVLPAGGLASNVERVRSRPDMCLYASAGVLALCACTALVSSRIFCDRSKVPLEIGEWRRNLEHMDTASIENPPVSLREGQIYVYENYFPNQTIKYIHVDNLAVRSCGAGAHVKAGGVNASGVLIVLHAGPHQDIRTVIDIWGTKERHGANANAITLSPEHLKQLKSKYLNSGRRAVNHNIHKGSHLYELFGNI